MNLQSISKRFFAVLIASAFAFSTVHADLSFEEAEQILKGSTMPDTLNSIVRIIGQATKERRNKNYPEALAIIGRIEQDYSSNPEILAWANMEKGLSLTQQGHYELAFQAYESAFTLRIHDFTNMISHSVAYEESKILEQTGRVDEAIARIQNAILECPDYDKKPFRIEQMRNRLGRYYNLNGEFLLGKETLESVRDHQETLYRGAPDGELMLTYIRLAEAYLGLEDRPSALRAIDQAVGVQQQLNERRGRDDVSSLILIVQGRLAEDPVVARYYFRRALEILENQVSPDQRTLRDLRARLY